jgi:membrane protein
VEILHKFKGYGKRKIPMLRSIAINFAKDVMGERITITAGHLAYVSLLSLVPVVMVFFMVMSAFPAFEEIREEFEGFIFSSFVPTAGDVLQNYMTDFVGNASGMGATSIIVLLVVAIMLISNIDKAFNHLWKTKNERPIIFTFAIYWMVITLGPLLIGVSIAVSSYLGSLATFADDYTPGFGTAALALVPWLAAIGCFMLLYMIVPNRHVRAKYALFGALLATALFEVTKQGFAFYISNFPSYEVIYGALATIPILFVWVYLSWIVVLLGAVFTYSVTMTCEAFEKEEASRDDGTAYSPVSESGDNEPSLENTKNTENTESAERAVNTQS